MWRLGYRVRLVLQQPSDEAFQFLQQKLSGQPAPLINRVDVALDLISGSLADAEKLPLYIDSSLYKPYHRPAHIVTDYQGTTYIGFKNGYTKYVIYADKPSRHIGLPCCHLECRFQSTRVVSALGIRSITDLLAFDYIGFWSKRLRLYQYDVEALGKRWNRRRLNHPPRIVRYGKWTRNLDKWTGAVILRLLATTGGKDKLFLADLLAHFTCYGRSLAGVLVPVDIGNLLGTLRPVGFNNRSV